MFNKFDYRCVVRFKCIGGVEGFGMKVVVLRWWWFFDGFAGHKSQSAG